MNKELIVKIIGLIMLIEAALMLLPIIVCLLFHEDDWDCFLLTAVAVGVAGALVFGFVNPKKKGLSTADGFIITAVSWILLSAVGAVPFCFSGVFHSYLDAFFETVAGFTTTGVTILADVTVLSHGMLFWRSLTHWIGGMGVIVFILAVIPSRGGQNMHLMRAESPGPSVGKLVPRIRDSAKILYILYIVLTVAEILALIVSGLPLFESSIVSFGTVATGGFAYLNTSLATLTVAQQIIVEVFMLVSGVNFGLLFLICTGNIKKPLKNEEFRWYLILIFIVAALISYNLISYGLYDTPATAVHHAIFGSISSTTSTGFSSTNMNGWPWFSKGLIILMMYIGGCAGSTAGGIKVSRFVILIKTLKSYLHEAAHPRSVREIRMNGKKINPALIRGTLIYFCLIMVITVGSMIIVSQDPQMGFSTSLASVATTLNNNGIEFHGVAVGGYGTFQWYTKIVYIFDMIVGRLEIFPVLILLDTLFSPVETLFKRIKKGRHTKADA